jgi:hypothetical protein
MKLCCYCGLENEDIATVCSGCGNDELRRHDDPPPLEDTLAKRLGNPVFVFRSLILISIGGYALIYLEHNWGAQFLSQGSRTLLEWDGYGSAAVIPTHVLHLQSILYLCLLLSFIFQGLLAGMTIQTPLSGFAGYVVTLANGGVLVLAYSVALKKRFT